MAAIFDKPSTSSPPLRPKFSLGGQVCRYSSNPQIGGLASGETDQPELDQSPVQMMPRSTPARSLNPELLMREFTRDDQGRIDSMGVNDSPSACFQSQFAREVVQNTRRSSSVVMLDQGQEKHSLPSSKNSRRSSMTTAAAANTSVKYRSQFAAKYHQPGQDDDSSDSTCEEQEMHLQKQQQKRTSILLNSAVDKMTAPPNEPLTEDDNLWMTSTQFSQLLDKQEAIENMGTASAVKPLKKQSQSYLDSEALLPFAKLKQTCDDLGFTYSDKEWLQIRKMLQNSGKHNEAEMVVRSEDFFAAIHTIMANKQNRQRMASGPEVKHHPNSMKSDSGGEMESCRSSDSELERELHEKEREIQERDRELTNCYRTIAERDTELIKVRLECQRLLEDNRHLRDQLEHLEAHTNPKKQMEMEKEIDSLKWHLSVMENSRKSYESATQQLVSFLEHVTSMLQATSPSQRKLFEATKAQVLKTTGKNYKQRFSLGGSSSSTGSEPMFRAESMPGLNMRGSMLSLSTNGGDNMSLSSSSQSHYYQQHLATMPRRHGSTSSGSSSNRNHRNVHRSQSTHSKRSPMPSLQESTSQPDEEVDYVNTTDLLAELTANAEPDRPKSVAEISQKENVCNIKITKSEEKKPTAKRSASSVSKRSTSLKPNDKASRLLGIDEHHHGTTMLDSGRFSMGSSLSPTNEKKSLSNTTDSLLKIQDGAKFKSLGDLHMEKGLPTVLVQNGEATDEDSKTSLLHACRRMLKSTKKILARETKTLEITPLKASKSRSSLPGSGQKQTLQLISHTTFPGLPTYPVLAASHSSPWNC